jgi:hypothetical protein
MTNTSIPKSLYRVYECFEDCHDYDSERWYFQSDNLGHAHSYAYDLWKNNPGTAYTIIQPYDESCRGHYGIKGYDYEAE